MDVEEKKNKMIEIRNRLKEIFNDSKDDWQDKHWCSSLIYSMGFLDEAINKIGTIKKKNVGE